MPLQVHEHVDASLPDTLPMLHGIKEFQANLWSDPVVYNPAPICQVAAFMPNLETFSLSARDQSDNGDEKIKHRVGKFLGLIMHILLRMYTNKLRSPGREPEQPATVSSKPVSAL